MRHPFPLPRFHPNCCAAMLRAATAALLVGAVGAQPGGFIDKSTHSCSLNAATNAFAWLTKYLPVEEADDDCYGRKCQCGEQSRVALKVASASANASRVGVSPGFGIHCTYAAGKDASRAKADGGTSQEEIEARFASAIGDWSGYDTDPNVRAWASYSTGLWAISGLDWYVSKFKADGVKYHAGSWQSGGATYWSVLVLVPPSPVVLELQGSCTVCGAAAEKRMPDGYTGTPPAAVAAPRTGADAEQGLMYNTHISRAATDLDAVKTYYKSVFGADPSSEATLSDGAKIAEYKPNGGTPIRYVQRGGQTGSMTTEWFQGLLLDTARKYQTSGSACWPIWGDFHYSGGFNGKTILQYVTAAEKLNYPYRSFAGSSIGPSNAYMVEPSGMWIQVNGNSAGLPSPGGFDPNYCYTFC